MQETMIVERLTGEFAVCEQAGQTVDIPLDLLPDEVRVGDVYHKGPTGWILDPAEVERRRALASENYKKLFGNKEK